MEKKLPGILVVGSEKKEEPILNQLELSGRYRLIYAANLKAATDCLEQKPNVVLLRVPAEKGASQEALACLGKLKEAAPVVVISGAPDMRLYLGAMTLGAFDFFTSYTPLDEAKRVLDRAISWKRAQAA